MDEALKALGPYPILQLIFGMVVLGLGVLSILRGLQGKATVEDPEALWRAREDLHNIEENSWKIVDQLQKQNEILVRQNELVGRFISAVYNDKTFRGG